VLTWRDRLAAQKASQSMSKEERRKAMPYTTEFIDWCRAEFGDPIAISASENGHSIEWRRK
jgi:hypothetical protein